MKHFYSMFQYEVYALINVYSSHNFFKLANAIVIVYNEVHIEVYSQRSQMKPAGIIAAAVYLK